MLVVPTGGGDLLHVGTFIAHGLLGHLEAPGSELCRPHLLPAVTLPLARSFFGYRFVANNLRGKAVKTGTDVSVPTPRYTP